MANVNAAAARLAAEGDGIAATARETTADHHRLDAGPSGKDRTSLMVSTRNEPGALYQLLEPFHKHGISLTRIESRPSKTSSWSYVFFIDFEGHRADPNMAEVLAELSEVATDVKFLGSYPRAVSAD